MILWLITMIFASLIGIKNGLEENSIPYGVYMYIVTAFCLYFIGYRLGDLLVSYYT